MIIKSMAASAVFAVYVFAMFAIASIPDDMIQTAETQTVGTVSIE